MARVAWIVSFLDLPKNKTKPNDHFFKTCKITATFPTAQTDTVERVFFDCKWKNQFWLG